MKITIPEKLEERMAMYPGVDFNRIALSAIEEYIKENKPALTFSQKEAKRILLNVKRMI